MSFWREHMPKGMKLRSLIVGVHGFEKAVVARRIAFRRDAEDGEHLGGPLHGASPAVEFPTAE